MTGLGFAQSGKWLVFPRDGSGARAPFRLFCFHHAGGGASMFRRWPALLGHLAEVVAVQLPGRESRFNESFVTDAAILLDSLVAQMSLMCDRPTILFGHSLGALIAHEMALRLQDEDASLRPAALIVSGQRPPRFRPKQKPEERRSSLPANHLLELVNAYEGTPAEVLNNAELRDLLVPLLRSDFRLAESLSDTHRPGMLSVPLLVLGGKQDPIVPADELPAWADVTSAACRLCLMEGGHFFVKEATVRLACIIEEFMAQIALTAISA